MTRDSIKYDEDIALTIALKYNQLKRDSLENLEIKQFIHYLFNHKWKKAVPETIPLTIVDIMESDPDNIVAYLSKVAVIEGKKTTLGDYDDLFKEGGY